MTDEQRPWRTWPEDQAFIRAVDAYCAQHHAYYSDREHEQNPGKELDALMEARDALCARVWREAQQTYSKRVIPQWADTVVAEDAERTRADAAEAQRDRLASVLEDVLDWIELDGTGNRSRIIRNARAALADVREEER